VPLLPASLTEPPWVEFAALIESDRPEFDPTHPWGSHRRRIPDRVVFDHVIAALVHGSGYERVATAGCSDRTIRRRVGAENPAMSRDLHVLVEKAAEPISSEHVDGRAGWSCGVARRRVLLQ
jgi:hypothetical protein